METPVNEKSSSVLQVSFFDDHDVAIIPISANYKIDDVGTGTVILAETALSPLSSVVSIDITSTQNRIINSVNTFETRIVTVKFVYGTDKLGTGEYIYTIKNLFGIS